MILQRVRCADSYRVEQKMRITDFRDSFFVALEIEGSFGYSDNSNDPDRNGIQFSTSTSCDSEYGPCHPDK